MKNKLIAAAGLGVVAVAAAAGTASAAPMDDHNNAPHSVGDTTALINGDLVEVNGDILDDTCVAPWHWDGPIQVLTDNGPYQACQEDGGVQTDAPAVNANNDNDGNDVVGNTVGTLLGGVPFVPAL